MITATLILLTACAAETSSEPNVLWIEAEVRAAITFVRKADLPWLAPLQAIPVVD